MDDQFVKKLGILKEGVKILQAKRKGNTEKEVYCDAASQLKMRLLDKLVKCNPIKVLKVFLETEIEPFKKMTCQ